MTLPFYDGKTILELLLIRLKDKLKNLPIYVATSTKKADDAIFSIARNAGIEVFRGEENNVLKRMLDAASFFEIENIIRVCADNPFLNAEHISTLFTNHRLDPVDYLSYRVGDTTPAILSHFGFYAELVKGTALRHVLSETNETFYLEHVTNYVYTHPDKFQVKFVDAPPYIYNRSDIRLTVDTLQDFELAQTIYSAMIKNNFSQEELVNFIDLNQAIKNTMHQMIEQNKK